MVLKPPPFHEVDDRISLKHHEASALTLGQVREMIEGYGDEIFVWFAIGGQSSPVRPVVHMTAAPGYILLR